MTKKTVSLDYRCSLCRNNLLMLEFHGYGFDSAERHFDVYRCPSCQIAMVYPLLSAQEVAPYYSNDYYGGSTQSKQTASATKKFNPAVENLVRLANRARGRQMVQHLSQEQKTVRPSKLEILDIGCGRGNFLKTLAQQGYRCTGIDIVDFEDHPQITFLKGSLEEQKLAANRFDAISIWHVLEHTQNPATTLAEIVRILKPGGILAVAVPNYGSWQSQLFRKHWLHLDLPRHLFHITQPGLLKLLAANQMEPVSIQTLSLEQNIFGFMQSALNLLFAKRYPNLLFFMLKRARPLAHENAGFAYKALSVFLGGLLFLPALLETLISAALGKGASLIVYAKKV